MEMQCKNQRCEMFGFCTAEWRDVYQRRPTPHMSCQGVSFTHSNYQGSNEERRQSLPLPFWIHSCKGNPPVTPPSRSINHFTSIDVSTGPINKLPAPEQIALTPTDVNFQWVEEALPSRFVKGDINIATSRYVILFTTVLFTLLSNAKTWYVDAMFKAVKHPFYQMWSIHAFIQQKDTIKQVPLLLLLMSCRMKDDYINILQFLKRKLTRISVQCVVMNFEQAFRSVFPTIYL